MDKLVDAAVELVEAGKLSQAVTVLQQGIDVLGAAYPGRWGWRRAPGQRGRAGQPGAAPATLGVDDRRAQQLQLPGAPAARTGCDPRRTPAQIATSRLSRSPVCPCQPRAGRAAQPGGAAAVPGGPARHGRDARAGAQSTGGGIAVGRASRGLLGAARLKCSAHGGSRQARTCAQLQVRAHSLPPTHTLCPQAALEVTQAVFGTAHPLTAHRLLRLASVRVGQGRGADAAPLLAVVADILGPFPEVRRRACAGGRVAGAGAERRAGAGRTTRRRGAARH